MFEQLNSHKSLINYKFESKKSALFKMARVSPASGELPTFGSRQTFTTMMMPLILLTVLLVHINNAAAESGIPNIDLVGRAVGRTDADDGETTEGPRLSIAGIVFLVLVAIGITACVAILFHLYLNSRMRRERVRDSLRFREMDDVEQMIVDPELADEEDEEEFMQRQLELIDMQEKAERGEDSMPTTEEDIDEMREREEAKEDARRQGRLQGTSDLFMGTRRLTDPPKVKWTVRKSDPRRMKIWKPLKEGGLDRIPSHESLDLGGPGQSPQVRLSRKTLALRERADSGATTSSGESIPMKPMVVKAEVHKERSRSPSPDGAVGGEGP